jgi:cytochrome c556
MRSLCGVLILGLLVGASYRLQAQAPLTAAEYPAKMKMVAQTNGELQKALKAGVAADAVGPAKALSAIFADVEKFWAGQKKDDAVKLAASARMGFADAAAAAAKGDVMAAQMAAGNATANCKQCHGLYREGSPTDGFKFKAGAVTE